MLTFYQYHMADGKCAHEGCDGQEVESTGYCRWHDENSPSYEVSGGDALRPKLTLTGVIGTLMVITGLPMVGVGLYWMFDDSYVGNAIAGGMLLVVGGMLAGTGQALRQ